MSESRMKNAFPGRETHPDKWAKAESKLGKWGKVSRVIAPESLTVSLKAFPGPLRRCLSGRCSNKLNKEEKKLQKNWGNFEIGPIWRDLLSMYVHLWENRRRWREEGVL